MWALKPQKQEYVTIIFDDNHLCLSWIAQDTNSSKIRLNAYKRIPWCNGEVIHGIIYNPTALNRTITDFLYHYRLSHANLLCALSSTTIHEKCIITSSGKPSKEDTMNLEHLVWDYRYIGPSLKHDGFVIYLCGMPREYIFHYQLFALNANVNLKALTSKNMAYLSAYHYLQNSGLTNTPRTDELTLDMRTLQTTFSSDVITNTMVIHPGLTISVDDEYHSLISALGLFVARKELHEHH